MSTPYIAIRTTRDTFISDFPDAVAEPVGKSGFAAFGSAPVRVRDKLATPDLAAQMFIVLVADEHVCLAFAAHGEAVGYPPEGVRLRITDLGRGVDLEVLRQRVRAGQRDDVWTGVLVEPL